MGKVGNAAIEARELARARRIEMEQDRQERDDRIDDATAAVIAARAAIAAARASADASNTAARTTFEAALAANNKASASAVAELQAAIDAAVRGLVAERLTARQVVQLTELAPAEVRSIVRSAGVPITEGQAAAAPATRRESAR